MCLCLQGLFQPTQLTHLRSAKVGDCREVSDKAYPEADVVLAELSVYAECTQLQPDAASVVYEEVDGAVKACVRVAGIDWKNRWESGQSGVYQVLDETAAAVTKTSQVNDPELAELHSTDRIFEKMKSTIFGKQASNMSSLNAMAAAPAALPLQLSDIRPPALAAERSDDLESNFSWAAFRLTAAAPKQAAKAKAAPKKGSKRGKATSDAHADDMPVKRACYVSLDPSGGEGSSKRKAAPEQPEPDVFAPNHSESDVQWHDSTVAKIKEVLVVSLAHTMDEDALASECKNVFSDKIKLVCKLLQSVPRSGPTPLLARFSFALSCFASGFAIGPNVFTRNPPDQVSTS